MDIDSIGRVSDGVVSPIAPPPAKEEQKEEPVSQPQEVIEDSTKNLDFFA